MKLGEELENDLVDDQVLHEMAEAGTLSREDLIWPEESGSGWALAETIHGLFPEEKVALEVEIDRPEEDYARVQEDNHLVRKSYLAKKKLKKRRRLIFFMILFLGAACWHYRDNILEMLPAEVREQLPVPIDKEAVDEAERAAAAVLEQARADRTIADDKAQLEGLKAALKDGKLDEAGARKLMDLWFNYADLGQLPGYLAGLLDAEMGVTENVRLSVLTVAAVMNNEKLVGRSVNDYQASITDSSSAGVCIDVAAICTERISSARSMTLLKSFLEKQNEASQAWSELAALQLQGGSNKEAIASLKTACKHGGTAAKEQARSDKRFDSIRDSSSFRRITDE